MRIKIFVGIFTLFLSSVCLSEETEALSSEEIKSLVYAVNDAQNKMMLSGSEVADVEKLFSMYSDDFIYVHEIYGGVYTRSELYDNSSRNVSSGRYKLIEGRYKITSILTGLNAAAVERLEIESGNSHLAVFELKGKKVSKIIEYWK